MKRQARPKSVHAYIEKCCGYHGGRAIVAGTNFPVSSVVAYLLRQGMLPEELTRTFPNLTLAQVHDSLSYYYDHQAEIDAEVAANTGQDSIAAALPAKEILRFRFDNKTGEFIVSTLG